MNGGFLLCKIGVTRRAFRRSGVQAFRSGPVVRVLAEVRLEDEARSGRDEKTRKEENAKGEAKWVRTRPRLNGRTKGKQIMECGKSVAASTAGRAPVPPGRSPGGADRPDPAGRAAA